MLHRILVAAVVALPLFAQAAEPAGLTTVDGKAKKPLITKPATVPTASPVTHPAVDPHPVLAPKTPPGVRPATGHVHPTPTGTAPVLPTLPKSVTGIPAKVGPVPVDPKAAP